MAILRLALIVLASNTRFVIFSALVARVAFEIAPLSVFAVPLFLILILLSSALLTQQTQTLVNEYAFGD